MHAVAEGKTAARAKTGKKRGLSNVRGGMGTASRTVGLLGAIFTYAVRHRMRADNPVHGVMRPADGTRERRLSDAEYAALGAALRQAEAENIWPAAVAAARFLALTGWRSGEALGLRWADVDLARRTATLADTKTAVACARCRTPPATFCAAWGGVPTRPGVPADAGRGHHDRLPQAVESHSEAGRAARGRDAACPAASFASLAADLGYTEPTIAALVGHKGHTVTSRYIHAADAVLLAAADAVAIETANRMGERKPSATVVTMRA